MAKNLKPSAADITVVPAPEPQAAPASAKSPKVANQAITLLVSANPKRGKSAPRFELYRTSPDTHSYIAAGGYSADLAWDVKRGFIKLG